MALRNSTSTSSGLSSGAAPLANAEDDNSCECSDAGIYYASTNTLIRGNRAQQPAVLTLTNSGGDSIATGDSVDSGAFTSSSIASSLSISTQLSELTCVSSSGIASSSQFASSCDDIKDADADSDEEADIKAGFGERSTSSDEDAKMSQVQNGSGLAHEGGPANAANNGLSRHRSLEALVNSFNECLNAALGDMSRDVVNISKKSTADNNISTQEELVSDDPMWLHMSQPEAVTARRLNESIDWSRNVVREQLLLPALRMTHGLNPEEESECCKNQMNGRSLNGEKEDVDDGFADLYDMHSLAGLYDSDGSAHRGAALSRGDKVSKSACKLELSLTNSSLGQAARSFSYTLTLFYREVLFGTKQLQTADEVIEEINQIFNENSSSQNVLGAPRKHSDNYCLAFDNDDEGRSENNVYNNSSETSCSAAVANVLSEIEEKLKSMPIPLYEDKLKDLSIPDLMELMADLEKLTQQFSEILVHELALRDELQFEKEIKNTFITLVLRVQNQRKETENAERAQRRRRSAAAAAAAASRLSPTIPTPSAPFFSPTSTLAAALHSPVLSSWSSSILTSPLSGLVPGNKSASTNKLATPNTPATSSQNVASATMSSSSSSLALRYLSTVIPYQPGGAATSLRHLQAIIKILRAMSENSPTTTTLLTDYILNVLCPKE